MTFLAIGAATSPPVPVEHSIVTAMATFGSCAGANAMNHTWLGHPWPTSAVPVLPATSMPCEGGGGAGALLDDLAHHLRDLARPTPAT